MVVDDERAAGEAVRAGRDVVLITAGGTPGPAASGPGRLAVMIGDRRDPAVVAAAQEMDAELFGTVTSRPALPPSPA